MTTMTTRNQIGRRFMTKSILLAETANVQRGTLSARASARPPRAPIGSVLEYGPRR